MPPSLAATPRSHFTFPGGRLHVVQRRDQTVLEIARAGRTARLVLPPEEGIYAGSLERADIVGAVPDRVLILSSDYDSRPNGGSHQCGAGTETMVRVIALRPTLRQTFSQLVDSCWRMVESGEIKWDVAAGELTIERTTYDHDTRHVRAHYRINPDGAVALTGTDVLE